MAMLLPGDLLTRYIRGFWGYGVLASPVWIVGMEEGGESREDFEHKLACFDRSGDAPVQDLREVHSGAHLDRWFQGEGKLQPTWARFAQFLIAIEGGDAQRKDAIRAFQQRRLGRRGERHAMIELMPLPARKIGSWPYAEWSDLPMLQTRDRYDAAVRAARVERLRAMRSEHRPEVVLFCGTSYRTDWEAVVGAPLDERECCGHRIFVGQQDGTAFLAAPHPAAFGVTRDLFVEVAQIALRMRGDSPTSPG